MGPYNTLLTRIAPAVRGYTWKTHRWWAGQGGGMDIDGCAGLGDGDIDIDIDQSQDALRCSR